MTHDGIQRNFRQYVPANYDGSRAVPMVINLHGYTSSALQQEIYGDFRPIADTAGFILLHPDGTRDQTNTPFWNSLGSTTETVDDVGFISALIDTMAAEFKIDLNRVYATGMSNGGFMSFKLACELTDRIAAIASVTGSMALNDFNACNPSEPIPVMQIHGTNDSSVLYPGSATVVGIEELLAEWASRNNCDSTPVITAVPDIDTTDECTAEHWVYSGGDEETNVELFKVFEGGHSWPGADPFFIAFTGVTSQDFSASAEIWNFFRRYRKNGVVSVPDKVVLKSFRIYPNPSSGRTTLDFENARSRTIEVRNVLGQEVFRLEAESDSVELRLEESGLYFVSIQQDGKLATRRLLVN